jgi:sec-independent protein translocase protein TatA
MSVPLGPLELLIIAFIVLLFFGARRLPQLGRSLGTGMREFKEGVVGKGDEPDTPELSADTAPKAPEKATTDRRDPASG